MHPIRLASLILLTAPFLTAAEPGTEPDPALARRAQTIIAETFATMSQNLMQALAAGGVAKAVPFCKENVAGLARGLAEKHHVKIQRVSHKARNPMNRASTDETQLIAAMQSALSQGQAPKSQVVPLPDGSLVFYAPILIPADTCLKCHGIAGETLVPADHDFIRSLYPEDAATGFKLGDLRGLWKLTFPKP
jgi:hypothetical protein